MGTHGAEVRMFVHSAYSNLDVQSTKLERAETRVLSRRPGRDAEGYVGARRGA
jgi:hypothetical protein